MFLWKITFSWPVRGFLGYLNLSLSKLFKQVSASRRSEHQTYSRSCEEISVWLKKVSNDQWKHEAAHLTYIFPGLLGAACVTFVNQISDSRRIEICGRWNRTVESYLTLWCLMSTVRLHILKQTCSWKHHILNTSKLPNVFSVPCNCLKRDRKNV